MHNATTRTICLAALLCTCLFPPAASAQDAWETISTEVRTNISARPLFVFSTTDWIRQKDTRDLWVTTDAGQSWAQRDAPETWEAIHFFDMDRGFIIDQHSATVYRAYVTEDGGQTWPTFSHDLTVTARERDISVDVVDATAAFAYTSDSIFRSADGGVTWSELPGLTTNEVDAFDAVSAGTLYRGKDESLLGSTDGGQTWNPLHEFDDEISLLRFMTPQTGFAVTGGPFSGHDFWVTTDGGQTWATAGPGTVNAHIDRETDSYEVTTVDVVNGDVAFAGGVTNRGSGFLIRTDDGGQTWVEDPLPQEFLDDGGDVVDIMHVPGAFVQVVTEYGRAARRTLDATNTAAQGAEDLPEQATLSAAYPNPFNPQTQLDLTVDRAQHVRVAVYDLLGREVRVLFDGVLPAGQAHTVRFDAGRLPSGTYLVRARGLAFTTHRRVMLLK